MQLNFANFLLLSSSYDALGRETFNEPPKQLGFDRVTLAHSFPRDVINRPVFLEDPEWFESNPKNGLKNADSLAKLITDF